MVLVNILGGLVTTAVFAVLILVFDWQIGLIVLAGMDVLWSNGFIEGCNNKTKVLKRVCFGMRNFSNFRKRILFCHA